MRYFGFIFLISFFMSCSGTKRTIENSPKEISITEKVKDSITNNKTKNLPPIAVIIEEDNDNQGPLIEHETTLFSPEAFNHSVWNDLLKKHVSINGNVNYKGFKADEEALKNYIFSLNENLPKDSWIITDKLAYWVNAYNAFTIDLILRNYPLKSIKNIQKPWEQRLWKLADKWYNLNEIEHHILRKMNEPRIHFAIVCASISCPKLQNEAFTSRKLDEQLTKATKEFLADFERNSISENNLELSKIFQWFSKDFKQEGSLIDFLNKYSDINVSAKAKKTFKTYNWDLNE